MYKNIIVLLLLSVRSLDCSFGYWEYFPLPYIHRVVRFSRENSNISDIELVEHTLKWKLHLSKAAENMYRDVRYLVTLLPLNAGYSGVEKIQTIVSGKELPLKQLFPCRRYKIKVEPWIRFHEGRVESFLGIPSAGGILSLHGKTGTAEFVESGKEQRPYDVHCTHQGQTNLTLRWSPPHKCNRTDNTTLKRTVRYSIKAWRGDSDGKLEVSLVDQRETILKLSHLETNTVYQVEIRVQAADASSSTNSVTWVGSTAAQLPAVPQDVEVNVNQNNFRLTWGPTSEAVGAHKINCRSSARAVQFAAITNAGQNSLLVHEPPLRGNVTCHIRGSSEAGYGPPAEAHFVFLEQLKAADSSPLCHALYASGVLCLIATVAVLILCLRRMTRRR